MLLVFIIVVFFLLHIQFYVRNILFGTDKVDFFMFSISYIFDRDMSVTSLSFSTACILSFVLCYATTRRMGRSTPIFHSQMFGIGSYPLPLWPLITSGLLQVLATLAVVIQADFDYQAIAERFEEGAFILELRVIFLILLSHLLLNVRPVEVFNSPHLRTVRIVVYLYITALLLMQARSRVFEVAAILAFTHLMWDGDKVRQKYFAFLGLALIAPNIIVLGRLGWPEDIASLISGIFSFEYTVLFNNLLSVAIDEGAKEVTEPYTFMSSLSLVLPSPIRSFLGLDVVKSDYYIELAHAAHIRNGGFSLLAELFTNFGWHAIWVFGGLGGLIGFVNTKALRVGRVSLRACIAPLLYTAFILAFRNDLGVFLKYVIQLILIAWVMHLMTKITMMPKHRTNMT